MNAGCSTNLTHPPCCQKCCPTNYTESWYHDHPADYSKHPPAFLAQLTTKDENADLCACKNYYDTLQACEPPPRAPREFEHPCLLALSLPPQQQPPALSVRTSCRSAALPVVGNRRHRCNRTPVRHLLLSLTVVQSPPD